MLEISDKQGEPRAGLGARLSCENSMSGLLTGLFYAEALRPRPRDLLLETPAQMDLFDVPLSIPTQRDKALRVQRAIHDKLPVGAINTLRALLLCNRPHRGRLALDYARAGWRLHKELNHHLTNPAVWEALAVQREVEFEVHRLKGLARFLYADGLYYCALEPDHAILPLLAPHFADRMGDQRFVLHDIRREMAALYDPQRGRLALIPLPAQGRPFDEETSYEALWRSYHKTIAIQGRINPKLQRQFMPRRYFKHLPEMQPSPAPTSM